NKNIKVLLRDIKRPGGQGGGKKTRITLEFIAHSKDRIQVTLNTTFPQDKEGVFAKILSTIKQSDNEGFRNDTDYLIKFNDDEIIIPNNIRWSIKRKTNLDFYKKFWKIDLENKGNIHFTGSLSGLFIKGSDKFIISSGGEDADKKIALGAPEEAITPELETMAKEHSRQWLARCVERILYLAYFNEGAKFSLNNSSTELTLNKALEIPDPDDEKTEALSVNISPSDLRKSMEEKGLRFPWSIYQAACITLNLGRNLILVGPPGCGKTELALALGEKISSELTGAKMVTASPAWTSGDLIGRYFPDPETGNRLIFQRGIFLDALDEDQCLIIDEMNRANIDECFGELFTLLSGKSVDLPYKELDEESEIADEKEGGINGKIELKTIRINSIGEKNISPDRKNYQVGKRFRIIGTMNSFDRSSLHQMSFALLRRFNVIRIDPPQTKDLQTLLEERYKKISSSGKFLQIDGTKNYLKLARDLIEKIFISHNGTPGLVERNITGVASMFDSLKFVMESVRSQIDGKVTAESGTKNRAIAKSLLASQAMHAFMIYCAPQLESLDENGIMETKKYIFDIFEGDKYAYLSEDQTSIKIEQKNGNDRTLQDAFDDEFKKIYGDLRFE
ncbi:MAG: AAA family ATPase, partial [Proteobacteria bacterium]|nr:AAA family ATPase [Pseudomonadota bacterium]